MLYLKFLISFVLIISIQNVVFAYTTSTPDWVDNAGRNFYQITQKALGQKTLPESKWNNLRTTLVDGIYCQQVADDGTYKNQKHYFYNTQTSKMVEVTSVYYINSTDGLGIYKNEFLKYGAKSNTFTHNGKKYTIPNVMGY